MIEIGRVCIKTAGRDSGELAVVLTDSQNNLVLVDGNVRRKKCNVKHLEPTSKLLNLKEEASTADVHKAMAAEGLKVNKVSEKKKEKKEKAAPKVAPKKAETTKKAKK